MNKAEFINAIATAKDAPEGISKKDVQTLVELTFETLKATVKEDEKFAVAGFGTFTKKQRAARNGRNPRTGETIKIPASTTVGFKPVADLKKFMGSK